MNWRKYNPPPEVAALLRECANLVIANSTAQLLELACGGSTQNYFEVTYDVAGRGPVIEAAVGRVRYGLVANYPEPYMRRRDPDCMVIADNLPTNKPTFEERFGSDFAALREETLAWLKAEPLVMFGLVAGQPGLGTDCLVIAPASAAFFAFGLALLQGIIPKDFQPEAVIYVAPPFRHTHFGGKQVVVHNRRERLHELFSYNLYPGPSAKKGIYGFLQVDTQPQVGEAAFDQGADILYQFFRTWLPDFYGPDLTPLGRQIIECCLDGGAVEDYEHLIPV